MRIVVLEQYLLDILRNLGLEAQVVGTGPLCFSVGELPALSDVRSAALAALSPDAVLGGVRSWPDAAEADRVRQEIEQKTGAPCICHRSDPVSLDSVLAGYEEVGRVVNAQDKARAAAQRLKAQLMDWCDNFYDRMKNKRVSVLSAIAPVRLAGLWVPDMVALCSGISQMARDGSPDKEISWQELVEFRPDVILVAPRGKSLKESMAMFKELEKFPEWEKVPAVKRGEVSFVDGIEHFYEPGPKLMESMAILISAIGGLDSGYITQRDSFYRLRWLELQRHRI